ncbi:hypothetical protein [Thauera humireducens]|uniref:hypothetical protein n=1 Tax=Thauera humireducens TaxID=1134435 RepID=UPI00311E45CE
MSNADQITHFWRKADEASELFDRACYTHPLREHHGIKAHQSDLARRHRAGDPHVIRYAGDEADGIPEHYKLAWTTEEKARLQSIYLTARDWSNWTEAENEKESAAKLFVGILEGYGAALPQQVAIELPKQKERQRNLDSVANAFDKLVDSISRLDSAALAWLYATVEENAANVGMSVRPDGPDIVSLKRSWLRALAESGESRDLLNLFHSGVGLSIRKAAATLPKADRDDPRLGKR